MASFLLPWSILFINSIITANCQNHTIEIENVQAVDASSSGANITVTPLHEDVIINNTDWILSYNAQSTFDLKANMPWGLGANNMAKVWFAANIDADKTTAESIIMVISAGNEYKTFVLALNNTQINKVYPGCSWHGTGYIEDITKTSPYPTRIQQATNGTLLEDMGTLSPSSYYNSPTQIYWYFQNHPDCETGIDSNACGDDWLFHLLSSRPIDPKPQECSSGGGAAAAVGAFPLMVGLDVFLAVPNPGDIAVITAVYFKYQYDATRAPSAAPTSAPLTNGSYSPTLHPTYNPTSNPTMEPTTTTTTTMKSTLQPTLEPTLQETEFTETVSVLYAFTAILSIIIEIETDLLNITNNSTFTLDIVSIVAQRLEVKYNDSILGTPIVSVINIQNGYTVNIVISVDSNEEISLDEDYLVNDIEIALDKEFEENIAVKGVSIQDESDAKSETNVWDSWDMSLLILLGIGVFMFLLIIICVIWVICHCRKKHAKTGKLTIDKKPQNLQVIDSNSIKYTFDEDDYKRSIDDVDNDFDYNRYTTPNRNNAEMDENGKEIIHLNSNHIFATPKQSYDSFERKDTYQKEIEVHQYPTPKASENTNVVETAESMEIIGDDDIVTHGRDVVKTNTIEVIGDDEIVTKGGDEVVIKTEESMEVIGDDDVVTNGGDDMRRRQTTVVQKEGKERNNDNLLERMQVHSVISENPAASGWNANDPSQMDDEVNLFGKVTEDTETTYRLPHPVTNKQWM